MPESAQGQFKTAAELDDEQRGLLGVSARDNTLFCFQDDGSCVAKVRPWHPGLLAHLDIESIRNWATERNRKVKSVVVFGSHARGTNNKRSDVDLFVVGRLSKADKLSLRGALSPSHVDIVDRSSMAKFRAGVNERHLSIENQVMRHGVQIFGHAPQTILKCKGDQFRMDDKAFFSHFEAATQILCSSFAATSRHIRRAAEYGTEAVNLRKHVADSSDAAERTAKAILTCVGLSPEHKHDIRALVRQLLREAHQRRATRTPHALPDTEVLAKRIEAMNHETASQTLHTLVYHEGGVFVHHPDGRALVINAEERIANTIDNLVWLFAIIKGDRHLAETARRCHIELKDCFRAALRRESEESPTDVARFEAALGICTSLPETMELTHSAFEARTD